MNNKSLIDLNLRYSNSYMKLEECATVNISYFVTDFELPQNYRYVSLFGMNLVLLIYMTYKLCWAIKEHGPPSLKFSEGGDGIRTQKSTVVRTKNETNGISSILTSKRKIKGAVQGAPPFLIDLLIVPHYLQENYSMFDMEAFWYDIVILNNLHQ